MTEPHVIPSPNQPLDCAREFLAQQWMHGDVPTMRHWRGGWWTWVGTRWVEVEQRSLEAAAYRFTEDAVFRKSEESLTAGERKRLAELREAEVQAGDDEAHIDALLGEIQGEIGSLLHEAWNPNRRKIGDLLHALAAVTHTGQDVLMPSWQDDRLAGQYVACANGLLDVFTRQLVAPTPLFWNATAVPFNYDPSAPPPDRWHRFLRDLWGDDDESIAALQEWFGYVISGRLDLHKILLIVGPTRAGKGVIARTLSKLVGVENTAGPTLSSLNGEFGLAPLLGKTLAVVSDARLNGKANNVVVERLLSISGADYLTVNRKYRDQWTGQLPARLMLCSNELPQLGDASMAVAGRFVPLLLSQSWWGKEDLDLEDRLDLELPGILNWALDGLERLTRQRRFTRAPDADDTLRQLQDLASPVAAFVRDCCVPGADHEVPVKTLYHAWAAWAHDNGHPKSSQTVFGRDLRAALGGRLKVARPWSGGGDRERIYIGVSLTPEAEADLAEREGRLS